MCLVACGEPVESGGYPESWGLERKSKSIARTFVLRLALEGISNQPELESDRDKSSAKVLGV